MDEDGMGVTLCITQAPKCQNLLFAFPAIYSAILKFQTFPLCPNTSVGYLENVLRKILDLKVCPEQSYVYNPRTVT